MERRAMLKAAGLSVVLLSALVMRVSAQGATPFIENIRQTKNISHECRASVARIKAGSNEAKLAELFSGRVKDAEMILIPEIVNDIVNSKPKPESFGIAKYLFRPQLWNRGVADSCLYMEGFDFCNIDIFKRRASWGVCVPKGCNAHDIQNVLFPSPMFDELTNQWIMITCTDHKKTRALPTTGTWIALGVTMALLAFELICMFLVKKPDGSEGLPQFGTAASSFVFSSIQSGRARIQAMLSDANSRINWQQLLACFSLSESWAALTGPAPKGQFPGLDAVRVISFMWIILGHVLYFTGLGINWTNHRDAFGFYNRGFLATLPGLLTVGFYFAVDTFLFMSAFLAITSCFKRIRDKNQGTLAYIKTIPKEYLRRYLRLTPAYAMTIYTFIFVSPILVDGVRRAQYMWFCSNCKRLWWQNMLYVNNILSDQPMPMCYPVSWFLALLFQFQLLGPWFGLLAAKLPRVCMGVLLGICVASWWYSANLTETRQLRLNPMDTRYGYDRWSNEWYTKPWTRAPGYMIGCMFGIVWYYYNKDIKARLDKSLLLRAGTMVMSLLLLGLAIMGTKPERSSTPSPWSMLTRQFYISMASASWCVGFALLLALLFTGPAFGLSTVMNHPSWTMYGRLAYCVYLMHATILGAVTGSQGEPWHFTVLILFTVFAGVTVITIVSAVPLFLMVERPFSALADLLLLDRRPAKTVEGNGHVTASNGKGEEQKELELEVVNASGPSQ